eukprot:scaffold429004_cov36-Prasinocladus_malaysianus.AAC.1
MEPLQWAMPGDPARPQRDSPQCVSHLSGTPKRTFRAGAYRCSNVQSACQQMSRGLQMLPSRLP